MTPTKRLPFVDQMGKNGRNTVIVKALVSTYIWTNRTYTAQMYRESLKTWLYTYDTVWNETTWSRTI